MIELKIVWELKEKLADTIKVLYENWRSLGFFVISIVKAQSKMEHMTE